jgi:signal transduction histidine kinase
MYFDRLKITQLLKNIIINAIEAIENKNGKIKIEVNKEKGESVIIKVADNGVGIDVKDIELLFDEDYSTKDIGTGIGLFVAKRIVDLHNGEINIKSTKGTGTEVVIKLPFKDDN